MKSDLKEMKGMEIFSGIQLKDFSAMLGCLGAYERQYQKAKYIALDGTEIQHVGLLLGEPFTW